MLDRAACQEYFALTVFGDEHKVAERIERVGIKTFLPMVTRQVRCIASERRPKRTVEATALPGYVFVAMVADWRDLMAVKGVDHVVTSDGRPHPIAYETLSEFWARAIAGAFDQVSIASRMRTFSEGDSVRVIDGIGQGQETEVKYITGRGARMLLFIFNQPTLCTVPLDNLERI